MMVGALSDPFDDVHMGVTAENVAKKYGISREDQDALAVESHRRAQLAIDHGYFRAQVVPVPVKVKRDMVPFEIDETVRGDATVEKLAKMRPSSTRQGSVTAGNSSSINDAAAAVVLADRETAAQARPEADGPAGRLQLRRRRPEVHGHGPGAGGAEAARQDRPQRSTTSTSSRSTRPSPRRHWRSAAN